MIVLLIAFLIQIGVIEEPQEFYEMDQTEQQHYIEVYEVYITEDIIML